MKKNLFFITHLTYKKLECFIFLIFCCFLIYVVISAYLHFIENIRINSVGKIVDHEEFINLDTLELATSSIVNIVNSRYVGGYDYELAGNVTNWKHFLDSKANTNSESVNFYTLSSQHRPTWPNVYVELAKLAKARSNQEQFDKNLSLANRFGPHYPATKLLNVDVAFSDWQQLSGSKRVAASKQLLQLASNWNHRSELETMVTYSEGKNRICNMLSFNQIRVSSCQN
ncbi:hypothetical protein [uncultured Vibrio sp.]|uniref:hypothetical protein n=1 Tax=uncultured Vibrio sp. TaxID=114054 RepID=UPI0025DDC036|nr:hypothetical protein [uncultured Vibrio sp.]